MIEVEVVASIGNNVLEKRNINAPVSWKSAFGFAKSPIYGQNYSELIKNASVDKETGWLYFKSTGMPDNIYLVAIGTEFYTMLTGKDVVTPGEGEIFKVTYTTNKGNNHSMYFAVGDSKGSKGSSLIDNDGNLIEAIVAEEIMFETEKGRICRSWGSFSYAMGNKSSTDFASMRNITFDSANLVNIDSLHKQLSGASSYSIINQSQLLFDDNYTWYCFGKNKTGGWKCGN